jgi:hypothetical protein
MEVESMAAAGWKKNLDLNKKDSESTIIFSGIRFFLI